MGLEVLMIRTGGNDAWNKPWRIKENPMWHERVVKTTRMGPVETQTIPWDTAKEGKKNHKNLTRFFKFTVVCVPSLTYADQVFFHGLDVHVGTVALREFGATLTPAVIVLADELALWIAGNVAQSCLHKVLLQVLRKDDLKTWRKWKKYGIKHKGSSGAKQLPQPAQQTNKQLWKTKNKWSF